MKGRFIDWMYKKLGAKDDVVDTGMRQCEDGEFCNDPDCTHKQPHKKNTGCLNVCQRGGICLVYHEPPKEKS